MTDVPGNRPRSPSIRLFPVFVTVDAPRIANLVAVPRLVHCVIGGGVGIIGGGGGVGMEVVDIVTAADALLPVIATATDTAEVTALLLPVAEKDEDEADMALDEEEAGVGVGEGVGVLVWQGLGGQGGG